MPKDTPTTDKPDELSFESLAAEVAALKETVAQASRDDGNQQRAFDALYEELKQYKEDFIFQSEKALLLDLLLFYDSLNWFQNSLIKKEMSREVVADSFQYLIDEMLELLYRRDVLPMEATSQFDRKLQKVIKTVAADGEDDDYAIEQVLKRGFTRSGRLLRAEEVVVRRFNNAKKD